MEDRDRGSRYRDDDIEPRQSRRYDVDDEPKKSVRNKQPLIIIGVSVILSFLVVMIWANASLVSKKDFGANVDNILADMGKMQTSLNTFQDSVKTVSNMNTQVSQVADKVNTLTQDVADIKANMDKYAKVDSLTQTNTNLTNIQNSLNSLQTQVNNLKQADTSTLSASVESLKTQVAELNGRLEVLEGTKTSTSPGTSPLKLDVKQLSDSLIPSLDRKSIIAQIKMVITNPTSADIEDVIIDMLFQTESLPYSSNTTIVMTSSPAMSWIRGGWLNYEMEFQNGWGLVVKANDKKTIYATLTITDTSPIFTRQAYGYNLDVEIL